LNLGSSPESSFLPLSCIWAENTRRQDAVLRWCWKLKTRWQIVGHPEEASSRRVEGDDGPGIVSLFERYRELATRYPLGHRGGRHRQGRVKTGKAALGRAPIPTDGAALYGQEKCKCRKLRSFTGASRGKMGVPPDGYPLFLPHAPLLDEQIGIRKNQ
jgi:hypothetical protein